jgi:hypothetical protein
MINKLDKLLEILDFIEDQKVRMGTFINPSDIADISDKERDAWYKKASNADNEFKQLYYANRAIGYSHYQAENLAKMHVRKESGGRQSSEHAAFPGNYITTGFENAPGEDDVSLERKEAVLKLIDKVKNKFSKNQDATKILAVNLIQHGFDEIIPPAKIPYHGEISQLLKKVEAEGKTKWKSTPLALVTGKPPYGLGIDQRVYYKVMNYLKSNVKALQHNESFMTSLSSLFGKERTASSKHPTTFKLSNLEPMLDVIKRDIDNYGFKSYGLHLQGVTKEEGEDMLKDVPSIKHQYQGDALLIPLEPKTNLKSVLRKAIPGKKVILFGYDSKPKPLRKGWEGFPYKLVSNPTVVGSYSLSTESKSESLKIVLEGFQCKNYDHPNLACNKNRPCGWKGFPSIGEDMKRECLDYS